MHESPEKRCFLVGNAELIQIHPGEERVTYFFLRFRHFFFQSCCRGCVLHEHLTHAALWAVGESWVRQTRCPLAG